MKRRVSKLQKVSKIIQGLDTSNQLSLCLQLSHIWNKILGEKWAPQLKLQGYKNKCLWIQLPSSCHIQEMNFHKQEILTKINKNIPSLTVQDIRWVI